MSIFKEHRSRPLNLSMLFFEVFEEEIKTATDEDIPSVISKALVMSGIRAEMTEEVFNYCIGRMETIQDNKPKENAKESAGKGAKQFGEGALDWISDLNQQDLCLFVCDYDFDKALHLYCDVDRDDALVISEQKVNSEWEMMKVSMEAALFGFGGGYGDGPKEGETVIDLSEGFSDDLPKLFNRAMN